MRGYELCLMLHADLGEEAIESLLNNLNKIISKHKGSVLKIDKWGRKNFKYTIKKQTKGYYCFLYYMGNNDILHEIDRTVRFNESVLRFNTILLEKGFSIEKTENTSSRFSGNSSANKEESIATTENKPNAPVTENT